MKPTAHKPERVEMWLAFDTARRRTSVPEAVKELAKQFGLTREDVWKRLELPEELYPRPSVVLVRHPHQEGRCNACNVAEDVFVVQLRSLNFRMCRGCAADVASQLRVYDDSGKLLSGDGRGNRK